MNAIWQATIDSYMKLLYDMNPQGEMYDSVREFEGKLSNLANENEDNMDIAGLMMQSGLQSEYNRLYTMLMADGDAGTSAGDDDNTGANANAGVEQNQASNISGSKIPTVREFLDSYRHIYNDVKDSASEETKKAYEKLFAVEQRTNDLIEAQMIIEKEQLVLNTLTADYKGIAKEYLEAIDPNYEVTSEAVQSTIGVYAQAKTIDEITYMGEIASASVDDFAVQIKLKVEIMTNLMSLIFAWEQAKRKVREGGREASENASSMVVTRQKLRDAYRFICDDLGLGFDEIVSIPFYRILLLNPTGLDGLWRIKKVAHPANIEASRFILFEEVLSDKTIEEILMTPQPIPYYEPIDMSLHPDIEAEFNAVANELNKDIKYFRKIEETSGSKANSTFFSKKNRHNNVTQSDLIKNTVKIKESLADASGKFKQNEF